MLRFPQLKYTQMSIIFLRPEKFGITGLFGLFMVKSESDIDSGGEFSDRKR